MERQHILSICAKTIAQRSQEALESEKKQRELMRLPGQWLIRGSKLYRGLGMREGAELQQSRVCVGVCLPPPSLSELMYMTQASMALFYLIPGNSAGCHLCAWCDKG